MRVLEVGMIIIGMPLSIEHSHVRLCGETGSTQINTSRRRWYRSTQRLRLVSSSSPRASSSSGRSAPCLRQAPVPRPCLPSRMGSVRKAPCTQATDLGFMNVARQLIKHVISNFKHTCYQYWRVAFKWMSQKTSEGEGWSLPFDAAGAAFSRMAAPVKLFTWLRIQVWL